jgi:hypothetical protein
MPETAAHFFGLLHLQADEQSAMNMSVQHFRDQVTIYANSAITLATTLEERGFAFTLLTNNKKAILDCVPSIADCLQLQEIEFTTSVPSGIEFYSAHFKIDAFRYLSSLQDGYAILCDLDVLCVNDIPRSFENMVSRRVPLFYDISDQVIPAYGYLPIIQDLQSLHDLDSEGRWAGGEFIAAPPAFFQLLVKEIDDGIYDRYLANLARAHHVGDEAVTSAALERLRTKGVYIGDAGTLGIIGRYWNARTMHSQRSFDYFRKLFLLHLPADKPFLAKVARLGRMTSRDLMALYEQEIGPGVARKSVRRLKSIARRVINGN